VLPANVRLGLNGIAGYKRFNLLDLNISYEEKSFMKLTPGITILIQYEALAIQMSYQTLYQNAPMVILHLN
jgi:hypothetical protein